MNIKKINTTIYTFKNMNGNIFSGNINEIINKLNLDSSNATKLIEGKLKKHNGWFLDNIGIGMESLLATTTGSSSQDFGTIQLLNNK